MRPQKRSAVDAAIEVGVSERRACSLMGLARSTFQYLSQRADETELRARIKEQALNWRRFGYRRIGVMLRQEGWAVNDKRVYRIYQQEGLQVRRRRRKRVAWPRVEMPVPTRPNERWSMDFMLDVLDGGRRFRTLNIVDDFTCECLAIEVDTSLPGSRVVSILKRVVSQRGFPDRIVQDNVQSPRAERWIPGRISTGWNGTSFNPGSLRRTPSWRASTGAFGTSA